MTSEKRRSISGRSDRGIRSLVSPYKQYLLKRWNEGCYEALQLFQEIQPLGYLGSYDTVARYVRRLCSSAGIKTQQWSLLLDISTD